MAKKKKIYRGLTIEAANLLREYGRVFRYNEWTNQAEMDGKPIKDDDILTMSLWLQANTGVEWTDEKLWKAVTALGKEQSFNPLGEYLRGAIKWGGEDAILKLVALLNPVDSENAYVFLKRWLISGVARAMNPGTKADLMLVLVGQQGIGKSRFARGICPFADVFLEDFSAKITRDEKMKLRGKWIVEMSELKGLREARLDNLKSFLTATDDNFRLPYGRETRDYPRKSVFIGTTNESNFLRDDTGERRFMIVESQTQPPNEWDFEAILSLRDSVWAQAVQLFDNGEKWWLEGVEQEGQTKVNSLYVDQDPWTDEVLEVAQRFGEIQKPFDTIKLSLNIEMDLAKCGQVEMERVNRILRRAGWLQKVVKRDGKTKKVWLNPNPPTAAFDKERQNMDWELTKPPDVLN